MPILLVHGTRDAFGTREEIEPVFQALPTRVDFDFIERGDHSFAVPKSTGLSEPTGPGGHRRARRRVDPRLSCTFVNLRNFSIVNRQSSILNSA